MRSHLLTENSGFIRRIKKEALFEKREELQVVTTVRECWLCISQAASQKT